MCRLVLVEDGTEPAFAAHSKMSSGNLRLPVLYFHDP
jgi:hypothetical protein